MRSSLPRVALPDDQTFEVWGHATADMPFTESGLVPSREVRTIRAKPGLTISGKILPAKVAAEDDPSIDAEAYLHFKVGIGRVEPDGTFVIRGLPEGEYTFVVQDRSRTAGFRLRGPGVRRETTVRFIGRATWTLSLAPGRYSFVSPGSRTLRGSFRVT